MKKLNVKPLVISALTAVAFGAIGIGTTFALFTDNAETHISIGSGKVNVGLTASDLVLYSAKADTGGTLIDENGAKYVYEEKTAGSFTNGGTASLTGNVLTLDKVTPGDRVTFNVALADQSNVNIKYRLVLNTVKAEGEADKFLAKGLEVTTDLLTGTSAKYTKLEKYVSQWTYHEYNPSDLLSGTYHFDIALPITAGNEYQDKSVEYYISVEAVQGNAVTNDDDAGTFYFLDDAETVVANTPTVLEASNSDNSISVKTTIPADGGLEAGQQVDLVVSSLDVQNGTESTTMNFDVTLYVDGAKATSFNGKSIAVEVKLPTGKDIISVTHNGSAVTEYTYNRTTGILSFNTTTFSPFSVVYKEHTQTVIPVTDTASFQSALDDLEDNDEEIIIQLSAGNYGDLVIDAATNKGNTVVTAASAHNTDLPQSYLFDYRYRSLSNVKILGGEGVNVRSIRLMSGRCGISKGYTYIPQDPGNGEMYSYDGLDVKNLTIENIKFVGAGVYLAKGYNVYDWSEMIAGTQKIGDFDGIKVENCKFEPTRENENIPQGYFYVNHHYGGIHVQTNHSDPNHTIEYTYTKNVTVNNCEFKNILGKANHVQDTTAVYLDSVEGTIKITNNTFTNTYYNHIQINRGFRHEGTITITGNNFGDNHDRMLRFNDDYSGLTAFNCSGNYFDLTTTAETSGPYGKSSVSGLDTTYFADGKLPIGANYWKDSNIQDWTTTAVLYGFSINSLDQSHFA